MKSPSEINKILRDHERRLTVLEGREKTNKVRKERSWYKSGSTTEKIVKLLSERFFDEPRSIGDIVSELKTRDFHLKSSDLTLPLRKIVRKGLLRKTKKHPDGSASQNWLYTKG